MELTGIQQLNLDSIKDNLCILAAGHPMSEIGEEMQMLASAFEARAICHLLLDLDVGAFVMNLQRATQARHFFLRKSREQNSTDVIFTALSRTDTLFDCVIVGDWPEAVEIEALSAAQWSSNGEYEEDFCYRKVVHSCVAAVLRRRDLAAAGMWRDRLLSIVDGIRHSKIDVARLDVSTRFIEGNQRGFWEAFEALVEVSADRAAATPLDDGRVFEFPWLAVDRWVSLELLAWMALARRRGFRPEQPEYDRCPSIAWLDEPPPALPDIFVEMEARFGL